MLTPTDCEALLTGRGGKKLDRKKIDHNTFLERIETLGYVVILYDTNVLEIYHDGRYVLNSGGYRTVTTKERLNKFGPVVVYSKNSVWYAGEEKFTDYMTVTPSKETAHV